MPETTYEATRVGLPSSPTAGRHTCCCASAQTAGRGEQHGHRSSGIEDHQLPALVDGRQRRAALPGQIDRDLAIQHGGFDAERLVLLVEPGSRCLRQRP